MTNMPPLSEMPGHLIRRLNQHATAVFQHRLKTAGYDITSVQFAALKTLSDRPGLDQATLAVLIAYDRATIGGVVKRLEQKKLIHRQANKEDRRAFVLSLTPQGKTLFDVITLIVSDLQTDILLNLTESETACLLDLMRKVIQPPPSAETFA
jgi:DNA-binding MarR family transcriptional regulator